jgi:hypothetical protein
VATIVGLVILQEHLHAQDNWDRAVIAASALAMLIGAISLSRSRAAQSPPIEPQRAVSRA